MYMGFELRRSKNSIYNILEAMEMWTWRRFLKVSCTEMKSNVDILNQVGRKKNSVKHHKEKK